jgi:hypothetical protein
MAEPLQLSLGHMPGVQSHGWGSQLRAVSSVLKVLQNR